jgi:hypothetical protein
MEYQAHQNVINAYKEQIDAIEKLKKPYNDILKWEEARTAELEKQRKLVADIKKSQSEAVSIVSDRLAKTPEGQRKILQGELEQLEELLRQYREGVPEIVTVTMGLTRGRKTEEKVTTRYGTDQQKNDVIEAMAIINDEMAKLDKASEKLEDWQVALGKIFNFTPNLYTKGLPTVIEYLDELEDAKDRLFSNWEGKTIAAALGITELDQAEAELADMQKRLQEMMEAAIKDPWTIADGSIQTLINTIKATKQEIDGLNFSEYIKDLEKAANLPSMSAADRVKSDTRDKLIAAGISNPDDTQIQSAIDAQGNVVTNEYQRQLDIQQQLLSGKMTMKQFEIEQLQIEHGISEEAAERVYDYQKQAKAIQLLRDTLSQLGEGVLTQGISGLIDMAHELGQAFRDGADAGDAMSEALGNYLKKTIDALPQLLLSAGLQIMATNWKLGLAFIAASGLASFVSGMIDSSGDDDDQLARLQRIQDEISKLIDQQKSLEEYYFKKRQELNAKASINAMGVNDLIVTPQGSFSTHPDDFIIATRNPESLGTGTTVKMNVKIINNAGVPVSTEHRIGEDGINELLVLVDKQMQSNVASGKWDGSFATRDARNRGRNIKTS